MILKEDMEEARERMKAWWDHEIIDRPVISYFHPRPKVFFKGIFSFWCLAKHYNIYSLDFKVSHYNSLI